MYAPRRVSDSSGRASRGPGSYPRGPMAGPQPNGIILARPEEPAQGVRLAVKDLFDTVGLTTTYGSIVYAEHVPDRSAEAVTRLGTAGVAERGQRARDE